MKVTLTTRHYGVHSQIGEADIPGPFSDYAVPREQPNDDRDDWVIDEDKLIAARKAGIHLEFDRACAIDLATKGTGKTVLEAVRTSVNPKVIDCPAPQAGKVTIEAVAKDGIAVKVKARVTVRTNLDRFVGGATEETIIARVGEGIVTTIGSSVSYKAVLENPDRISKTVLEKGLDSGTAFEILSIDIADVDVGENVGAKLQAEQAEANKLIAQAQAEGQRRQNPSRYEELRRERYIDGVDEDRPAVISVNFMVASMAANELLARLHDYRTDGNAPFAEWRVSLSHGAFYAKPESPSCSTLPRRASTRA